MLEWAKQASPPSLKCISIVESNFLPPAVILSLIIPVIRLVTTTPQAQVVDMLKMECFSLVGEHFAVNISGKGGSLGMSKL